VNAAKKGSLVVLVLLGLSCGMPAVAGSTAACSAHGQAALTAWSQGKYDQVGRDFSSEAATALPPETLKAAWTALQKQAGTFKSLGTLQPRTLNGQEILVAPMSFAGMSAAALIACDGDDHIIGLRVVPASALPPATASSAR
jgi:hypothetical protein